MIFAIAVVLAVITVSIFLFLMISMPGKTASPSLSPVTGEQTAIAERLRTHVRLLAGEIGPRHEDIPEALNAAADYILAELAEYGYSPDVSTYGDGRFRNISAEIPGSDRDNGILVIGAHYDTARTGTPGADDNASGVAVMLEIANVIARDNPNPFYTVRFIAFPNEERPYFGTDLMGSMVSAGQSAEAGENILGMFSLEMLGYYSNDPASQQYPPVINRFYPDRGNFIAFVGNMSSLGFLRKAVAAFREQPVFPSEGMAAPESLVPDIRRSDNSSYWAYGYPALMVTDTSNFRNPHYHTVSDTPETLDFDSMARVAQGLTNMAITLANTVE